MNKLPMELEKNNIFKRCIKYIKDFFNRKSKNKIQNISKIDYDVPKKRKINDLYKIDNIDSINNINSLNNKEKKMNEIIDVIEKNPDVLEKLSINRLKIIDNYYIEQIEKCKRKLANITKN